MIQSKTFDHPMFGELPVIILDGKEYFGATNVANALEYKQPHTAVTNHCDSEGVITYNVLTKGGKQEKRFITIGNVSRLIVSAAKQSRNPEIQEKAKIYEKWIFDEVIPTVHKHGAYMTPQVIEEALLNPDTIIQLATNLKEEQAKRKLAEHQAWQANLILEQQKPKVIYAEAVEVSSNSILVKDLATLLKQKGVNVGQNRLFEWLRENDYLCKKVGSMFNKPTQKSMDLGLFELKQGVRTGSNGELKTTYTPKVTGKGQVYFINKFLKANQRKIEAN